MDNRAPLDRADFRLHRTNVRADAVQFGGCRRAAGIVGLPVVVSHVGPKTNVVLGIGTLVGTKGQGHLIRLVARVK